MTVDRSDQGDEAVGGEEDVSNAFAGLAEHIGQAKLNLLTASKQTLTIPAWQGGEQTIFCGGSGRL